MSQEAQVIRAFLMGRGLSSPRLHTWFRSLRTYEPTLGGRLIARFTDDDGLLMIVPASDWPRTLEVLNAMLSMLGEDPITIGSGLGLGRSERSEIGLGLWFADAPIDMNHAVFVAGRLTIAAWRAEQIKEEKNQT